MELIDLEQKIIKDIADAFPFSYTECYKVYQKCCSFDKTIQILDLCRSHCIDTELAIALLEIKNNNHF